MGNLFQCRLLGNLLLFLFIAFPFHCFSLILCFIEFQIQSICIKNYFTVSGQKLYIGRGFEVKKYKSGEVLWFKAFWKSPNKLNLRCWLGSFFFFCGVDWLWFVWFFNHYFFFIPQLVNISPAYNISFNLFTLKKICFVNKACH